MLIRYPGSKDKHLKFLQPYLDAAVLQSRTVYEPFSGTAAVTFHLLKNKKVDYYHINDIDPGLVSLWLTVKNNPEQLIADVEAYVPTVEDFYEFKNNPGSSVYEKAWRKLVLHQISYSGLGAKAGGPLGGRDQKSAYTVDCRWSPGKLSKTIQTCSDLLNSVKGVITNTSWEPVVDAAVVNNGFIYLDPPYYDKGGALYINGGLNHEDLAERLQHADNWVVSYDDREEIRELYTWADVQRLDVRSHLHHKIIGDVVITP